ncbi:hypothetical protein R9C00_10340 [Flammeovirgaceae bacterium SG7u.111]|nr:hypothetical protein [Flammeovirgaceae bacterium SG7u.132]WPO37851.1 hypothetical protein R9C00_10340 [Flammeovirgaceae bacterium SG7u.111]
MEHGKKGFGVEQKENKKAFSEVEKALISALRRVIILNFLLPTTTAAHTTSNVASSR